MSGIPSLLMRTSAEAKRGIDCRFKKLGSDMFKLMLEVSRLATYIWVPEALPIRLVRTMRTKRRGSSVRVSLLRFCPRLHMVS